MATFTKTVKQSGTVTMQTIDRADLTEEALVEYAIPLSAMRVHDNFAANLASTATSGDMGLVTGTPGTDAPTLQGSDFGGGSVSDKATFQFALPPEYVSGGPISLRLRAAMLTTVSDGTATVDVECWPQDDDGGASADICATAAQSINSLTPAAKTFTITPTNLLPGEILTFRLSFGGSDAGDAGVMVPEISKVSVLLNIRG